MLSSPSVMSVEEGATDGLLFCLEVTEYPGVINKEYLVESFPIGSAKSKTTMVVEYAAHVQYTMILVFWCLIGPSSTTFHYFHFHQ